ncbi:proton channel OTOP2-like isoform X2 [Osmerus eperlanus]
MDLKAMTAEVLRTCRTLVGRTCVGGSEVVQANLSDVIVEVPESFQNAPSFGQTPNRNNRREGSHNVERVLSGIIALNVLILACAVVSGGTVNDKAIGTIHQQIFFILLVSLSTVWMLFYTVYTFRRHGAVLHKDVHAFPVWLRGGLVLFCTCSLVMDVCKIANYVGYLHCDSAVEIVFPAVHTVFILVQTYFFWTHAKDCVQLQRNITRCGLMLTLSTNLVLWMSAVTEESIHQAGLPMDTNTTNSSSYSNYEDACHCSHSACSIFKKVSFYLYPFNIEYSLSASAMAYVMWKNVGRMLDEHSPHEHRFHLKDVCLGPVAGMVLLVVGLATFVVYEVDVAKEDQGKRDMALMMHYLMNLVAVSLMSICSTVGCVIYRLDERDHVSGKNPTRSLDVVLLVGASMGQFTINYFTIVAVVASGEKDSLNAFSLACSLLTVVQLGLQNFFIIVGLHRQPFHQANPVSQDTNLVLLNTNSDTLPVANMTRNVCYAPPQHRLTWKRKLLKEICAFLLLANILLWIMPAFGARPQFDHTFRTEFYSFTLWASVVNIGLPFGIFYRMHSVASLFEVFLNS